MNIPVSEHHFLTGMTAAVLTIFALYFLYRLYKRVGRRCRNTGCGSVWVQRINKIHLGDGETISIRSADGKLRWWIRRVSTETFAVCQDEGCGHTESVKYSEGPISVWHAWYVKLTDPNQYKNDPKLDTVSFLAGKDRLTNRNIQTSANSTRCDIPPIKI